MISIIDELLKQCDNRLNNNNNKVPKEGIEIVLKERKYFTDRNGKKMVLEKRYVPVVSFEGPENKKWMRLNVKGQKPIQFMREKALSLCEFKDKLEEWLGNRCYPIDVCSRGTTLFWATKKLAIIERKNCKNISLSREQVKALLTAWDAMVRYAKGN